MLIYFRFLTEKECGYVALVSVFLWLVLGRWIERYTSRDFIRVMLEHIASPDQLENKYLARFYKKAVEWWQRKWDAICPLFLQRLIFTPEWNRRSQSEVLKHAAFWRSKNQGEHRYVTKIIWSLLLIGIFLFFFPIKNVKIDIQSRYRSWFSIY